MNLRGALRDVSRPSGFESAPLGAHHGAAFADFDHDGRIDIAVSALNGGAELWRNETPGAANWLSVRLVGSRSNRNGIGAEVRFGGQWSYHASAVGYASTSLGPVHFGVGEASRPGRLEIAWPSGIKQSIDPGELGRAITLREP